jgi:hypothetical protein
MDLEKIIDKKSYRDFKGADWPAYESFVKNDYTASDKIKAEIDQFVSIMHDQYNNLSSTRTIELSNANQKRQEQIFYNKSFIGPNSLGDTWS